MQRFLSWPLGLAGFLGLNAWTVWGFIQSPLQVIGDNNVHRPFFVLLACVAFPVTMVMGGRIVREQIAPMVPSRRFHSLTDDMRSTRHCLENGSISEGWLFDRVSTLRWKMDRLRITAPPIDQRRDWVRWLVLMAPLAETGNIRAARKWKLGDPLPNVVADLGGY